MSKSHKHAGNVNLRGKKYKLLKCKCCSVKDLRDKLETIRLKKEFKASLV